MTVNNKRKDKEDKYYCKAHAKKQKYKIPTKDQKLKRLKKLMAKHLF